MLSCFPPAQLAGPKAVGPQLVDYPAASAAAREEGHTLISYTVRVDGAVEAVHLEQTSGHARLDSAALAAAPTWRFDNTGMNAQFLPMRRTQYVDFEIAADGSGGAAVGNLCLSPPPMTVRAMPKPLGQHTLDYPLDAISDVEEGSVGISFEILPDGSVANPAIVKGSGHPLLDQAAVDSVRAWRYQPISAPFFVTETLTFSLKNIRQAP